MIFLGEAASALPDNTNLWVVIVGAVASIVTAFIVPAFTLRSSSRSAQQQQQAAVLQQGNELYDRLKAACDEAERERDEARKDAEAWRRQYFETQDELARLRNRVWVAGYDPELIGREPPSHGRQDRKPGR